MKCKVCGAINEDYLEYCENCAAPLKESQAAAGEPTSGGAREQRSWDFVASPDWSKPEFSANTVSETDIPEGFTPQSFRSRFSAEPVQQPASASAPEAPAAAQAPNSVRRNNPQSQQAKRNSVRPASKAAPSAVCPDCGAPLAEGQRFCNSCGKNLGQPAAVSAPVAAAGAAGAQAGIKYADPLDEDMFSFNYEDEEEATPRRKKGGNRSNAPARSAAPKRSASRKRSGLAMDKTLLFWIAAGVLILALVVLGVVLVSKNGGFSGLFGGIFSSSPITKEPVIEKTTTDSGVPAYNITIYAKRNSVVHFEGGSIVKDTPVTKTSKPITLCVPEAVWVPSEPVEGNTLEIYPDITVIAKDGTETPVTFAEPIVISVPTLNLSVTAPNTPSFETATPDITFSGVVDDPTSAVYVNDMQFTVDEAGAFEGVYTLETEGTHTINVEARKNGYAIARQTFQVTYSTGAATTPGTTGGGTSSTSTPGTMPSGATAVGYVTSDGLRVRSEASSGSDDTILGELPLNQKVYIMEQDVGNSWAKILYNGSEAYVSNLYIKIVDNYSVKDATVTTDNLNARAGSSSSTESLFKLPLNTKVSYISDAGNGWSLVEYDDKIFFVATDYLDIA